MQPFATVTNNTQIRRLGRLARTALEAYNLEILGLQPLQYWRNATFRVVARPAGSLAPPSLYALRVQRPGASQAAALQSEVAWLATLAAETDLMVPTPVPARNGALTVCASAGGVPDPREVALFRWVSGRFRHRRLTAAILARVGETLAQLHVYGAGYTLTDAAVRPRWDLAGLLGAALDLDTAPARTYFSLDAQMVLDHGLAQTQAMLTCLDQDPASTGLIHGDFHLGNCLFSGRQVGVLDFETWGWGYCVFDIATLFTRLLNRSDAAVLQAGFLQGYTGIRPLSEIALAALEPCVTTRLLARALWLAALSIQAPFGAGALARSHALLDQVRVRLAGASSA